MSFLSGIVFSSILLLWAPGIKTEGNIFLDDICGHISGQRIYLEYGEMGTLEAKYQNITERFISSKSTQKRCFVEFISCPSCVINIRFRFLNLSRDCGRSLFDGCGCDYVWIYEPTFEQSSQQFCGRFVPNNSSSLEYKSQTRKIVVEFLHNKNYDHGFTLDYFSERNKIQLTGFPKLDKMNNGSQIISSPFFPNLYPSDLTMEHIINCEAINVTCRISLVFTDFLLAPSTIIDFFDWNSDRIYVTTGNIFRPPVIITSGPSLVIRFYANGATNLGFKAYYSFVLGQTGQLTPTIDCGGQVNNLGGGITMMNMVDEGLKSFDCIWLIKPPEAYLHMKTHLYVKVVNFSGFAGSSELTIRQGLTSNGPIIENLKLTLAHFYSSREREHIVPISEGFYIRLKGIFGPESRLGLVYAAFNYKECLAGSDFLCHNKRCISALLKCDGFDHCGDNSDEFTITCSEDPWDRRQWSKTPHFFFPKVNALSELATSTLVFLLSSFGLIGFIFAIVILLYRINIKTRHQRQIQDHIETINAILEEGVGVVEEEIIIPDDPPDYEAPPTYEDVIKTKIATNRCSRCNERRSVQSPSASSNVDHVGSQRTNVRGTSRSCQTTPVKIPDSPPPAYDNSSASYSSHSQRLKIFENLQLSFVDPRNCSGESFFLNVGRLVGRRRENKCSSDSELGRSSVSASIEEVHEINQFTFKKSFTTDDVLLFF